MQNLFKIRKYSLDAGSSHTFRPGRRYHIIFVLRGACQLSENGQQFCRPSDIIFLKPGQSHMLLTPLPKTSCLLLCVSVPEESLTLLSDSTCDLAASFRFAPHEAAIIHGETKSVLLLRNMAMKLDTLREEAIELGRELYEKSLFTTFLALFLRTCIQSDQVHQSHLWSCHFGGEQKTV